MKHLLDILLNTRIASSEILGTLCLLFLLLYGAYKAWIDFIAPLFRKAQQRDLQPVAPRRGDR
jgi:hypothetical protein